MIWYLAGFCLFLILGAWIIEELIPWIIRKLED